MGNGRVKMSSWNDKSKVGIDIIDRDHHRLFDLIDTIQAEHVKTQQNKDVILNVIRELRNYTNTHFKREEALMIASDYDIEAFNPHRVEHEYFENMVRAVDILYKNNEELINIDKLMGILRTWLTHHIGIVDRAYVQSVNTFCKRFKS